MNSWDLEEFKNLLKQIYGEDHLHAAEQSIDSLGICLNFSIYHYNEYIKLYKELSAKTLIEQLNDIDLSVEEKIAANILACLHNMNHIHDILGQVLKDTLYLKLDKKFYLSDVKDKLKEYPNLQKLLNDLTEHEDYKYLKELINQTKHNAVVVPFVRQSFIETLSSGVILPEFKRKKVLYPEKDAKTFLNEIYSRESNLVAQIGQELNQILKNKVKDKFDLMEGK